MEDQLEQSAMNANQSSRQNNPQPVQNGMERFNETKEEIST